MEGEFESFESELDIRDTAVGVASSCRIESCRPTKAYWIEPASTSLALAAAEQGKPIIQVRLLHREPLAQRLIQKKAVIKPAQSSNDGRVQP